MPWLVDKRDRMRATFAPRVKGLDLDDAAIAPAAASELEPEALPEESEGK